MIYSDSTKVTSLGHKIRPGPKGTSCLTCKQRHKKCDQRLPTCERCKKGGFACLGYDHNSDRRVIPQVAQPSQRLIASWPAEDNSASSSYSRSSRSSPSEIGGFNETLERYGGSTTTLGSSLELRNNKDELALSSQLIPNRADGPLLTFQKLINLYTQLPYSPSDPLKAFLANPMFDDYVLVQQEKLAQQWYFQPTEGQIKGFQKGVTSRLQNSLASIPRWISLIDVGICEAFLKGDASQTQLHNLWITHIQNTLKRELSYDTTSHEVQEQRSDLIHVSLLKVMITHSSYTYQILRSITPAFLQVVFSDPTLWPRDCNPTYIPLSSILCAEPHELAYFALIDCSCAMAFGLPQQLEYDTTVSSKLNRFSFHQWANGCPTEFQLVLADINACRDQSSNARSWTDIEGWLLAWQSRPAQYEFTESWMTVAWYAVQESWRLALLAYLYMAVCNVSSDDPRVQSCVTQILPVLGTVKRRESSGAEVLLFVQYLIAGICARKEAHRRIVRDTMAGTKEPKFWLMRGSDFVPVLDHLWHGAGAGGRPVQWIDYMRSREATLPVIL
ncbi:hypothetical protein ACGC1H_005974 [Rhizoctonia solani]|uniref:Zn(2)-C6 fungal-type domain-containing protein n=1 Tax=Rhizoctonia solani TaxID=456999 RepID=A0A8H3BL86_9AGAM|nr:unnamed protein product [Rhizoctonia solani]